MTLSLLIDRGRAHAGSVELSLSLALADLVFICVCVPFTALLYSTTQWPLGVVWCKLYQYLINVTAYASVYTLVRDILAQYYSTVI